jgi:hypothetical protein
MMLLLFDHPIAVVSYPILAYLVLEGLRRLFLHPLKRFPGPPLAALTLWYRAYYDILMDGGWSEHLNILHTRYGDCTS